MAVDGLLNNPGHGKWAALLFVGAVTAFVASGYMVYIPSSVFYAGMQRDVDVGKLPYVLALYVTSVAFIFIRQGNYLPKVFAWIFFVLSNLSYYTFYDANPAISGINVALFAAFCAAFSTRFTREVEVPAQVIRFCFWLTIVSSLYFFASNGFRFDPSLFLLQGVYDVRFEVTGGRNFFENALFSTTSKLFSLIAFGYYVQQRDLKRSLFMAASIALLYSTSAQKSILFFAALTFAVCYARDARTMTKIGVLIGIVLGALSFLPQGVGSASWAGHSFLTRRLLLIPAWLNDQYLAHYQSDPLFLSHSVLNGVFRSYSGPGPTWDMAYRLWGFRTSLNNGVFSDGFINFGYPGAIAFLIIVYVAILFQARITHPAARAVLLVYIWQFTNSALITTFVTHGFGIFVLLGVYLYRRRS